MWTSGSIRDPENDDFCPNHLIILEGTGKPGCDCRTTRLMLAIPAQFHGLTDTANASPELLNDVRYGEAYGASTLAKALAAYDRSDPRAPIFIIRTRAELNQMLTLVVAIKLETPFEPELLLFAGMNDHVDAAGLLEL